jgi:hypothetical protein
VGQFSVGVNNLFILPGVPAESSAQQMRPGTFISILPIASRRALRLSFYAKVRPRRQDRGGIARVNRLNRLPSGEGVVPTGHDAAERHDRPV